MLESSQLEVASYESSIDRASGAYSSVVSTVGGIENSSRGDLQARRPSRPSASSWTDRRITGG